MQTYLCLSALYIFLIWCMFLLHTKDLVLKDLYWGKLQNWNYWLKIFPVSEHLTTQVIKWLLINQLLNIINQFRFFLLRIPPLVFFFVVNFPFFVLYFVSNITWALWFCFPYMTFQAYLLFGDEEYLYIFQEAYAAAMHYLYHDPW